CGVVLGALRSFPTRRSSDLQDRGDLVGEAPGLDGGRSLLLRGGGLFGFPGLARRPCRLSAAVAGQRRPGPGADDRRRADRSCTEDRKSTRLNSSHVKISYAV